MTSLHWFLLALFVLIGSFQIYLVFWDRRIHYHAQNLTDGKLPTWRHGRCWWYITSNDDKKWFHGPGARAEWSFFRTSSFSLTITVLDDEGDDVQLHVGIPYMLNLFLTLERQPLLDRLPYQWRRNFGYQTGIKIFHGTLWVHVFHSDMWGTRHGQFRKYLPSWISIAVSAGYAEWRGVGFYISFDFDRLIFGSYERTEKTIGEPITAEIPIEPDNSLGLHYFATFQQQEEVRWRGNFPWRKKRAVYWDISTDHPPMHAGKGENSYDLDDDGIFGTASTAETLEGAIADYRSRCERDRGKYGFPSGLEGAFWAHEDKLIEQNIRAALRGEK